MMYARSKVNRRRRELDNREFFMGHNITWETGSFNFLIEERAPSVGFWSILLCGQRRCHVVTTISSLFNMRASREGFLSKGRTFRRCLCCYNDGNRGSGGKGGPGSYRDELRSMVLDGNEVGHGGPCRHAIDTSVSRLRSCSSPIARHFFFVFLFLFYAPVDSFYMGHVRGTIAASHRRFSTYRSQVP